ncbi:MAG: NAD(P)-dependent alcohol dehydrogenase [Acidimicrobiales bacterium]|nr:NAD(P)-dependent alcohol dehydrogenase [Acidimicrobiales bacterium]
MSATTATTAASAASIAAAASTTATSPERETMQAIVQHRYGAADVLEVAEIERPTIDADEVLVRVKAAGVDRGTWHLMTGLPYLVRLAGFGIRRPKQTVPGLDLAGTVVGIGADVTGFAEGDEVYGIGMGTLAEYATAKASKLAHRPERLTPEQAATIAVSGSTAAQAVLDAGAAKPGQRVLILGASGGVGSFATQIAHAHGLHVTGVASAAKADHVRGLGADVALDYATDDFTAEEPFDLIIDTGGRNPLRRLRKALTPEGTLVVVGGEGGNKLTGGFGRSIRAAAISPFVSQRLVMFMSDEGADRWKPLRDLIDAGEVEAPVDRTYPLAEAATAIDDLAAGRIRGKAVIIVA